MESITPVGVSPDHWETRETGDVTGVGAWSRRGSVRRPDRWCARWCRPSGLRRVVVLPGSGQCDPAAAQGGAGGEPLCPNSVCRARARPWFLRGADPLPGHARRWSRSRLTRDPVRPSAHPVLGTRPRHQRDSHAGRPKHAAAGRPGLNQQESYWASLERDRSRPFRGIGAHRRRGCIRGLKPPVSSRLRVM